MSSYFCTKSRLSFILLTNDFRRPTASVRFSGKFGCSVFHGHATEYRPFSYLSVSLNLLKATLLSDSTGESDIPIDSSLQKSSKFGFKERDLSTSVYIDVSLRTSVPYVIISILASDVSFLISDVLPDNIYPNLDPSIYKPACTSIFCGNMISR